MTSFKLIIRNVLKNIKDYFIYFLTLTISVSLFYAFNSISSQPAFSEMGMTKTLLYNQLGILLSALSVIIAIVLAFLIIYANQFILKRRKKELGIYMLLGMKKKIISRIFAGETLCIGIIALATGLVFGFAVSQGLSLISIKLFATDLSKFQMVFSKEAFSKTIFCFMVIFFIVMIFNILSVSNIKLIDLLSAIRKNENLIDINKGLSLLIFLFSLLCIITAIILFLQNGILPSGENLYFQIASIALIVGTLLFFYSVSTVIISIVNRNKNIYFKGLNTFLIGQICSKIHTNYFIMAIVCGLLTITICAVSVGVSTALAMNGLSKVATPYDLNVMSDIDIDGDGNIVEYLKLKNINMDIYAESMDQISLYDSGITYGELFQDQNVNLWAIDESIPDINVIAISISDFNRAMAIQGKEQIYLNNNEFLINCNYKGTLQYIKKALNDTSTLTIAGITLQKASNEVLDETYFMTSVGNNDRGTLILPDYIVTNLKKDNNVLLVQYNTETNSDEILQKMIPIGLDDTHGYRYSEKNMIYDMFYGMNALISFLCCYIGLIFLLICAALLALKQLTETTDNIYRYGLLQKMGANMKQIDKTLLVQIVIFFTSPLVIACIFSIVLMSKAIEIVEEFLNIHISTNMIFTIGLFFVVYGGYFLATYLSCKKIIRED